MAFSRGFSKDSVIPSVGSYFSKPYLPFVASTGEWKGDMQSCGDYQQIKPRMSQSKHTHIATKYIEKSPPHQVIFGWTQNVPIGVILLAVCNRHGDCGGDLVGCMQSTRRLRGDLYALSANLLQLIFLIIPISCLIQSEGSFNEICTERQTLHQQIAVHFSKGDLH